MSRLMLFLITLGALAALVLIFLTYNLTAAVATGVVLALAGAATTVVLRLAGSTQQDTMKVTALEAKDADRAPAIESAGGSTADDQLQD
jgi:hypothetical protein